MDLSDSGLGNFVVLGSQWNTIFQGLGGLNWGCNVGPADTHTTTRLVSTLAAIGAFKKSLDIAQSRDRRASGCIYALQYGYSTRLGLRRNIGSLIVLDSLFGDWFGRGSSICQKGLGSFYIGSLRL